MNICKNCGEKIEGGYGFCPQCGQALIGRQAQNYSAVSASKTAKAQAENNDVFSLDCLEDPTSVLENPTAVLGESPEEDLTAVLKKSRREEKDEASKILSGISTNRITR